MCACFSARYSPSTTDGTNRRDSITRIGRACHVPGTLAFRSAAIMRKIRVRRESPAVKRLTRRPRTAHIVVHPGPSVAATHPAFRRGDGACRQWRARRGARFEPGGRHNWATAGRAAAVRRPGCRAGRVRRDGTVRLFTADSGDARRGGRGGHEQRRGPVAPDAPLPMRSYIVEEVIRYERSPPNSASPTRRSSGRTT